MGSTTIDGIVDSQFGRLVTRNTLPTTPAGYYGNRIQSDEWRGGEIIFHSGDSKLYVQVETSGKSATWKRVVTTFEDYSP